MVFKQRRKRLESKDMTIKDGQSESIVKSTVSIPYVKDIAETLQRQKEHYLCHFCICFSVLYETLALYLSSQKHSYKDI